MLTFLPHVCVVVLLTISVDLSVPPESLFLGQRLLACLLDWMESLLQSVDSVCWFVCKTEESSIQPVTEKVLVCLSHRWPPQWSIRLWMNWQQVSMYLKLLPLSSLCWKCVEGEHSSLQLRSTDQDQSQLSVRQCVCVRACVCVCVCLCWSNSNVCCLCLVWIKKVCAII